MASSSSSDQRTLEFEALVAIYEQDLKIEFHQDNSLSYRIDLKDTGAVLSLSLSDCYPDVPPDIKVSTSSTCNLVELEKRLKSLSKEMQGEVMVFDLIEEAKQFTKETGYSNDLRSEMISVPDTSTPVCKFFLKGTCRFGDKCINRHQSLHLKEASNRLQSSDKSSKCINEASSLKTKETASSKKPPMKTASDVISRILWDDKINAKDFCIGYLDRFVGIIERPFTDFSWEDIAAVDYNELSIPRHRIRYFKYFDEIVWNKKERLDNIFGSTGSGFTIHEVIKNFQLEGIGNQITANEKADVDETINMELETPVNVKHANVPNYFIGIRIENAEIFENVDLLQRDAVSREQVLADCVIPSQNLHITLLMLTIKNEHQLTLVKDVLKGIQHCLPAILPTSHQLIFKGVGSFKDRILYVQLDNDSELQKWVKVLTRKLQQAGICLDGNKEVFVPHLTILRSSSKISPAAKQVFSILEMLNEGTVFGKQAISEVGIFSRFDSKRNTYGFHSQIFHIKNSFFAVLPTLKDKLLQYVANKDDRLRMEVETLLQTDSNADKALSLLKSKSLQNKESERHLILILRGVPGCGKTFLVENSLEAQQYEGLTVCSSKQFFYRAGNASINQAERNIADSYCRNGFLEALTSNVSLTVVDDCHSQCWQYALYQEMAAVFGIPVKVLEISCNDQESIKQCYQYTETTLDALMKLVEEWEDDTNAVSVQPWFKQPHQCRSLRELVK